MAEDAFNMVVVKKVEPEGEGEKVNVSLCRSRWQASRRVECACAGWGGMGKGVREGTGVKKGALRRGAIC